MSDSEDSADSGGSRPGRRIKDGYGGFRANSDGLLLDAANAMMTGRYEAAKRAGLQFGGDRDLYDTLGYKRQPSTSDYWAMYLRHPLGRVIVNAPAATAWRVEPEVDDDNDEDAETEFETAVEDLFRQHRVTHYMERADKVAGIGEYGLIVLGFADGEDMSTPVEEGQFDGVDDLAYLATFSQDRVVDLDVVTDPTDERYGLPEFYAVDFDPEAGGMTERVHWTRVIHIAEELLEDEIHGRPRLEAVYNTLFDFEKVLGGAAEMTWRGAGLRMQLNIDPEMGTPPDAEEVAEQAEEMIHGLRNIIRTRGTEMNVIDGQTVDPSGITEELLKLIAGETGIPQRILTGSERGELASTQDRATFYGRIAERQEQFCEPQMVRPFIDRLIMVGVLPEPVGDMWELEWPNLFELSELEQAELMEKMANALANAAPMGDPGQVATVEEIRELIFDWSPERGSEVDGESLELVEEEDEALPETEEDREVFDELGELLDGLDDVPDSAAPEAVATDGGEE